VSFDDAIATPGNHETISPSGPAPRNLRETRQRGNARMRLKREESQGSDCSEDATVDR
jgi:hypothetical protein